MNLSDPSNCDKKRGFNLFGVAFGIWLVCFLISISFIGAVVYIAVHFLSKAW